MGAFSLAKVNMDLSKFYAPVTTIHSCASTGMLAFAVILVALALGFIFYRRSCMFNIHFFPFASLSLLTAFTIAPESRYHEQNYQLVMGSQQGYNERNLRNVMGINLENIAFYLEPNVGLHAWSNSFNLSLLSKVCVTSYYT